MEITCISDLHGEIPVLSGGDLLIIAGDLTATDKESQYDDFWRWLCYQDYEKKVVIAGNHDGFLEKNPDWFDDCDESICYLCDSGTTFRGLKIWGSPWTPEFCNWHFMLKRGDEIAAKWALIPDDTDILVTHGPPCMILDRVNSPRLQGDHVGCADLYGRIQELPNLKLHVFGHIHESYGIKIDNGRTYVNASIMTREYKPENKPIQVQTHEKLYIY